MLTGSLHARAAQAALALTDEQVASICTEYDNMTAALNAVYSEQKAMLSNTVEVQAQTLMTDQVRGESLDTGLAPRLVVYIVAPAAYIASATYIPASAAFCTSSADSPSSTCATMLHQRKPPALGSAGLMRCSLAESAPP